MKVVKRLGVFETNSSSSHSVELLRKDKNVNFREEIPEDEREIRTPLNKMLMTFGLIDRYVYFSLKTLSSDESYVQNIENNICLFKKTIIDKYNELFIPSKEELEEIKEMINEGEVKPYSFCHCLRYFNEDVLCDCTCGLDDFFSIKNALGITDDTTYEYQKGAEYLFDPDVYYYLEEGWFGGCWDLDKNIF